MTNTIRNILQDLERVRENMLALSGGRGQPVICSIYVQESGQDL